jgi:nitric oxide reductase activation protein
VRIRPLLILLLTFLLPVMSRAAAAEPPQSQNPARDSAAQAHAKIEKEMAKQRNEARQAELKSDTEKLLQLSTELKEYVDKTNENILSLDVIRKAEEIEKLAHSVKEKMKTTN